MAFETALVYRARIVISFLHVLRQLSISVEIMLMCKRLLMPGAQITDLLLVYHPDMAMQIRPTDTRHITSTFRTIILQ